MASGGNSTPTVLILSGIDPGGGAGLIADVRTVSTHRCWPAAVPTAHTVQQFRQVDRVRGSDPDEFSDQLAALLEDHAIDAVKVGLLASSAIAERIVPLLTRYPSVVDPVLAATSGRRFVDEALLQTMREAIVPAASLITPNRKEAARLAGLSEGADLEPLLDRLHDLGATSVALTMGHAEGGAIRLVLSQRDRRHTFEAPSTMTDRTHGTGCLFSSGVAAHLAHGVPLAHAVERAHRWVARAVADAHRFRHGGSPDPSVEVEP